ncbi:uncharacterized protein LOC128559251 [Mercenaria mercenaria]|uniref:uncharacterized protein LOC128559251 n=1 Tax=Mercenaria mercenaria TaxID=6596 RepID=UPI00234F3FDD|nr:uncharacterized protein LOC128559251 [Mercenaria mercenaria]
MEILYRVLKPNEDPSNGIKADDPYADYTVMQHVGKGTYLNTQFISTSKTSEAMKVFAEHTKQYAKNEGTIGTRKIVEVDVRILRQYVPDCIYIDLTDQAVLNKYIPNLPNKLNTSARNFAHAFEEVLLQPVIKQPSQLDTTGKWIQPILPGIIPPQCIKVIGCV